MLKFEKKKVRRQKVKDGRDEYFEGHSRQDKVRLDEERRHPRTMQFAGGGKIC